MPIIKNARHFTPILKHGSFTFAYPSFIILLELYRQRTYACFVVLGNCLCCNANLYCSVHRENEWRAAMLMGGDDDNDADNYDNDQS